MKLLAWMVCFWFAIFATLSACAKKDAGGEGNPAAAADEDDADDADIDPVSAGSLALSDNPLAASYPEGMAVTALPQAIDPDPGAPAAGTLNVGIDGNHLSLQNAQSGEPHEDTTFQAHPKTTLEEAAKVINGTAAQCFSPNTVRALTAMPGSQDICFGSDYGIIAGKVQGKDGQPNLGDPSIENEEDILNAYLSDPNFKPDTSEEACMVVKGRESVGQNTRRLNAALALLQGMLCQAKKDGLAEDVPQAGTELDLTSAFDNLENGSEGSPVSSAKLKRLSDQNERAVFRTEISLSLDPDDTVWKFILTHSPAKQSNESYNGVLQIITDRSETRMVNNVEEVIDRDVLTSMIYEKSGTTAEDQRLRFEVTDVQFVKGAAAPDAYFHADGRIDLNATDANGELSTPEDANKELSGMSYFAADLNPSSYAGKISVWNNPGGSYTETARGFVFETTQQEGGVLAGCSWAGAASGSIRKALKDETRLLPAGCFTPQIGNGVCGTANDNIGPQIWKQCFVQNSEGVYLLDAAKNTNDAAGFDVLQSAPDDMPQIDLTDIPGIPQ